jgi:hypothetical protein
MSDEKFPLPGSSYKELSKIIDAYATVGGATAPGPVAQIAVVHETVVSRNNKFLVAAGLVEGGNKKSCTSLGAKLGRAIQHDQTDAISEGWRQVVDQTDFLQKTVSAIRIRKGMEESALASHIAFTAGSSKNAYARAGAGAVIEILRLSGAIYADGSTLMASPISDSAGSGDTSSASDLVWTPVLTNKEFGTTLLRGEPSSKRESDHPQAHGVDDTHTILTISLNVSCTPDDLESLGPKLRRLKEDFEGRSDTQVEVKLTSTPEESSDHDQSADLDDGKAS